MQAWTNDSIIETMETHPATLFISRLSMIHRGLERYVRRAITMMIIVMHCFGPLISSQPPTLPT